MLTACSGDDVQKLFKYCQEKNFAIPALNITSSSTVVAALEAARDSKSPIILQLSQSGAVSLIEQWQYGSWTY
jgi:fructose-bisphosphate aldolase class II